MGIRGDILGGVGLLLERTGETVADFFQDAREEAAKDQTGDSPNPAEANGLEEVARDLQTIGARLVKIATKY